MVDRSTAIELACRIVRQEMEAIETLTEGLCSEQHTGGPGEAIGGAFWECAQILSACPELIWVTGVGTSAAVGSRFAHILTDCGTRSMFLSPSDGLHGHSAVMEEGDLLVALSRGGESSEVNQMVRIARERRVTALGLVANTDSTLARTCDHVLPIPSRPEHELMGYVATTSSLVFSAVCDALCAVVLEVKGYTAEQLAQTHPGGAVGQALSERVTDER
jgi:arabinose-5-phosphate isomerase